MYINYGPSMAKTTWLNQKYINVIDLGNKVQLKQEVDSIYSFESIPYNSDILKNPLALLFQDRQLVLFNIET